MEAEKTTVAQQTDHQVVHVGGVNDELGGVDPRADENLMRLSAGH